MTPENSPDPAEAGLTAAVVLPVWPGEPPERLPDHGVEEELYDGLVSNVSVPTLSVFPAPASNLTGTAVLVIPGGGYGIVATGHEGAAVAEWLNGLGVTAFVLKYRCVPYRHPVPWLDARRAMRLARSMANQFGFSRKRTGVLGFSAGGHLAATLLTRWDRGLSDEADPVERFSCRPDFGILVYPVIYLDAPLGHRGSGDNLLGKAATPTEREALSPRLHVTSQTAACFLTHARDDPSVKLANSEHFHAALTEHGIPAELYVVEEGGHGFGLQHGWPAHCEAWMRARGLLDGLPHAGAGTTNAAPSP